MSKINSLHLYPNPFRYRKIKGKIDQAEIFEEVSDNIKPFLANKFSLIQDYLDELGNFKSELKILRVLREKTRILVEIVKNRSYSCSKRFEQLNDIENYQKNLRYLELPVQPFTDKNGFEVQMLSNEILEDTIEEIEEGFTYVYEYCSKIFPESSDLWTEYALITPEEFPFISHDSILESTYEIFDKIFDSLQKNSTNFFNWTISGDLNTRLLKVIKPKIEFAKINYLFIIFESLLSLTLLLLIVKYLSSNSKSLLILKNQTLKLSDIETVISEIKKDFSFERFRIRQKGKKLKSKLLNFNTACKYKILKMLLGNVTI